MNRNPDVDKWLDAKQHPLDAAMRRARDIILKADDRVTEFDQVEHAHFRLQGQHHQLQPVEEADQRHVSSRGGNSG